MVELLSVCVGGALGSGARYLVGIFMTGVVGAGFPWGTLLVNALGSMLIGILLAPGLTAVASTPPLRLFLTTGIMGGFTTYSTFNYETLRMFQQGQASSAVLYLSSTVAVCLGMGYLGLVFAKHFVS